jgi:hypothetical protein
MGRDPMSRRSLPSDDRLWLSDQEFERLVKEGHRVKVVTYYAVVGAIVVGYVITIGTVALATAWKLAPLATPTLTRLGLTEWIDILCDRRGNRPEVSDVSYLLVGIVCFTGATLLPPVIEVACRFGRRWLLGDLERPAKNAVDDVGDKPWTKAILSGNVRSKEVRHE